MSYLKPVKRSGRYSKYTPPLPYSKDLGGFTFPNVTGRPHMGPFNKVMPTRSPYIGDEKYRQHDVGYGKLTNSYLNFNKYDQQLLDAPLEGAWDYVGKGVFAAKQFLDVFNTPSIYKGGYYAPKKDVKSKPSSYSGNAQSYFDSINSTSLSVRRPRSFRVPSKRVRDSEEGTMRPIPYQYVATGPRDFRPSGSGSSATFGGARGKRRHDFVTSYDYS